MSDATQIEGVAGLAQRFILETNTFLSQHWNEAKVWWPLKAGGESPAQPHLDDTAGTRTVSSWDAEELVSRLIRSCGILDPRAGFAWHPRCTIVLVVNSDEAQPLCRQLVAVA